MKLRALLLLSLSILTLSCSSKKDFDLATINNAAVKKDVLSVSVVWLKDKGKKFDLQMALENLSKKSVIVMLYDIRCAKGEIAGSFHHTFFNTGERVIDMRPGQRKAFNAVCDFHTKVKEGDYKIVVKDVFENPNDDGHTVGKSLASNIEWVLRADSK